MFARLSLFAMILAILGLSIGWAISRQDAPTQLTFLAVGQGDCTVFQTDGYTILVDVGPKTREGFDAGARIVLPKLREMGVRDISLILITHPDGDHVGGLTAVHRRYPNATIGISNAFRCHPEMLTWLKEAKINENDVFWIKGQTSASIGRYQLEIAAPPWAEGENDNDGSLFVRISNGPASAVLTGDASIAVEDSFGATLGWTAQVLKAGHHGSRTATGISWLNATKPQFCVISCGRENRFGHPHKSVLTALENKGISTCRTDLQGDIRFEETPEGFGQKN